MNIMSTNFDTELETLLDAGRVFEAHDFLLRELRTATGLVLVSCLYNLGISSRSRVGKGVEARKWFSEAAGAAAASSVVVLPLRELRANACENSMLLSLSFEEYEKWAQMLRELRPEAEILSGQYPVFMEAKQHGRPWTDVLFSIAASYYRDGDPGDPGLYAEAVATYELMLANRLALRLDRTAWMRAVTKYGILSLRLGSRACPPGSIFGTRSCPEDPSPFVNASMPYLEEYVRANPADREALKILGWQRSWLDGIRTALS